MTGILAVITAVYGSAGATAILLQTKTVLRNRQTDVSLAWLAVGVGGFTLYFTYGLVIGNMTLIVSDAIGLLCGIANLATCIKYHTSRKGIQR